MTQASAPRRGYALYLKLAGYPLGQWLFTRIICLQAPYFASIRPLFKRLEPGRAIVFMRKRRRVQNHIGTVHALAMGNLCELAAGLVMEASLTRDTRWIPKGMSIEYLAKAHTDVAATATVPVQAWPEPADVPVEVTVRNRHGEEVVRAVITMYVSPQPRAQAPV
jgi:acyl-coenzyme A thioesterase PaaI-like protein